MWNGYSTDVLSFFNGMTFFLRRTEGDGYFWTAGSSIVLFVVFRALHCGSYCGSGESCCYKAFARDSQMVSFFFFLPWHRWHKTWKFRGSQCSQWRWVNRWWFVATFYLVSWSKVRYSSKEFFGVQWLTSFAPEFTENC